MKPSIITSGGGRLWWQRYGPRPDECYRPLLCSAAGAISQAAGDVVAVRCADGNSAGEVQGGGGPVEGTLRARLVLVNQLVKAACPLDLQVLYGDCGHPGDRVHGWRRIQHLHQARVTGRTLSDLSSLGDDPQAIMVDADFRARATYEIEPLTWTARALASPATQGIALAICDLPAEQGADPTCPGVCLTCQRVYILQGASGGSTVAKIQYTLNGGAYWGYVYLNAIPAASSLTDLACWGGYLVIADATTPCLWLAELPDPTAWQQGPTMAAGPLVLTSGPDCLWAAGSGGYVWRLRGDPNTVPLVRHAGQVTGESLRALAVYGETVVAAGDDGALIASNNGGATWWLVTPPTLDHFTALHLFDERGWLVGTGTTVNLWYTSDAGLTWRQLSFPHRGEGGMVAKLAFGPDPAVGLAALALTSGAGWLLRTIDGGATWHNAAGLPGHYWPATTGVTDVAPCDVNRAWAITVGGQVLEGAGYSADRYGPDAERVDPVVGDVPEIWVGHDTNVEVFDTAGVLLRTITIGFEVRALVCGNEANFGKAALVYYDTDRWKCWRTTDGGLTSTVSDIVVVSDANNVSPSLATLGGTADLTTLVFGLAPTNVLDAGWCKVLNSTDSGATWALSTITAEGNWDLSGAAITGRAPYSIGYHNGAFYVGTGRHAAATVLASLRSVAGANFDHDIYTVESGDAAWAAMAFHRSQTPIFLGKWASGTAPYWWTRNGAWASIAAAGDPSDHEWRSAAQNRDGVLVGSARLVVAVRCYYSVDAGVTWTLIDLAQLPGPPVNQHCIAAGHTANPNVYVGTTLSRLYTSADGPTWTLLATTASSITTVATAQP